MQASRAGLLGLPAGGSNGADGRIAPKGASSGYDETFRCGGAGLLPRRRGGNRTMVDAKPYQTMLATERLICAVLRGGAAEWRAADDESAVAEFLEAGHAHGVLPLLDAEFRRRGRIVTWPNAILEACSRAARDQAMFQLAHRAEIGRVLEAFAAAGIAPLLLKGSALAHSHYPNAALRPRADTDLLIPDDRRTQTGLVLARLGYGKNMGVEGRFVSYQATWSRSDNLGAAHHLDVHWRISNSQVLARTLAYDELAARAVPLTILGRNARAPAAVDALLFACIHRAGHANAPYRSDGNARIESERLIWLYDIHLLVDRMSAVDLDEFTVLASSKQIRAICLEALERTRECFATPIPENVIAALGRPGPSEASARYLSGGRARQMLGDFLALDRWRDRVGWVRELAFPSADYMRAKYPDADINWLPLLYARRAAAGVAGLILPHAADRAR